MSIRKKLNWLLEDEQEGPLMIIIAFIILPAFFIIVGCITGRWPMLPVGDDYPPLVKTTDGRVGYYGLFGFHEVQESNHNHYTIGRVEPRKLTAEEKETIRAVIESESYKTICGGMDTELKNIKKVMKF